MALSESGALGEWRKHGTLPLAAALGYATSVIHIYGLSVYIGPISETFGWSRVEVTLGISIATILQAIVAVPIGLLVDRVGPRRLALTGLVLTGLGFANLGNATGSDANWYLSWILMSVATMPIQATIWTSAVASRFSASRGLALAVTLCGAALALSVFPVMGERLISVYGWQKAMRIEALIWIGITWPVCFLFFRGAHDRARGQKVAAAKMQAKDLEGVTLKEGLLSGVYMRLFAASLLFTFTIIGLNVHFPLLLKTYGFDAKSAADITALIGLSSLVGRLGTGLLLDRFRGSLVGAFAFVIPSFAAALMLAVGDTSMGAAASAILIGVSLGAEIDVIVYLTTRYFGLKSYGGLYGGLLSALSLGTAFGPLAAARVFDVTQSYTAFLWGTIGCMLISAVALLTLPLPPVSFRKVIED